ncbi:hypothetical protein AAKU61_004088 [Undibacterium sp. GrIS 1.2]
MRVGKLNHRKYSVLQLLDSGFTNANRTSISEVVFADGLKRNDRCSLNLSLKEILLDRNVNILSCTRG